MVIFLIILAWLALNIFPVHIGFTLVLVDKKLHAIRLSSILSIMVPVDGKTVSKLNSLSIWQTLDRTSWLYILYSRIYLIPMFNGWHNSNRFLISSLNLSYFLLVIIFVGIIISKKARSFFCFIIWLAIKILLLVSERPYGKSKEQANKIFLDLVIFLIVDKPLTRQLPELHQDNDDFIINVSDELDLGDWKGKFTDSLKDLKD